MRAACRWLVGLLLAGCAHTEGFPTDDPPDVGPHDPAPPVQLTLNDGADLTPAWRPDGSGILYGFESTHRRDRDRCLGVLPPGGGTRRPTRCTTFDPAGDTTNALGQPAMSAGGQLAWVETLSPIGFPAPTLGGIRVGTLSASDTGRLLRSLPYVAGSGRVHSTATHLAWLGDTALVYVGTALTYPQNCSACPVDTLPIGREVVILDVRTGTATVQPGTTAASAVAPDPGGGGLVLTLSGDSRVFRYDLVADTSALLHDFGGLGIARDPILRDSMLFAVVGGNITVAFDSTIGDSGQRDLGGTLYRVNLRSGATTPIDLPGHLVRHPALAPDGTHLVVETGGASPDLYLLSVP